MRKIQENGQAELDHILVEVRTLARLEHPNIVRYHSGWIEWAPLISNKPALESNGHKLLEAPKSEEEDISEDYGPDVPAIDVQFGYDDDDRDAEEGPFEMSFGRSQRFATQEEEEDIIFEDSRRSGPAASDTQSLQPG
jgi:hypothetical protein